MITLPNAASICSPRVVVFLITEVYEESLSHTYTQLSRLKIGFGMFAPTLVEAGFDPRQ